MSSGSGWAVSDIHSHLVPGVDDGARTLDDTLDSIRRLSEEGVVRLVTTPHLDGSLSLEPESLSARLAEVDAAWEPARDAVAEHFPDIELYRGHEVMLDVPDVDLSDPRMRMAGTSFVLIEWPRLHLPPASGKAIRRIVEQGYRPIVAHPERYIGIGRSIPIVVEWREAGAHLQVNYGSVLGHYGSDARRAALGLLRMGWVDYLATDFHGRPHRRLEVRGALQRLSELGGDEALAVLCDANPARVVMDEPPLPAPALPAEAGFWDRMKGILSPGSR